MALDDREWLPRAQQLEFGQRTKVIHCGREPSMSLSHQAKGYAAYCHRCQEGGFKAHGVLSLRDIAERKAALAEVKSPVIKLPKDFTTEIPVQEALWLLKGGVPLDIAKKYGFGFSAYWKRVILPVYEDKKLIGFTSRSTIGERPKYIARMPSGQTIFRSRDELRLPSTPRNTYSGIVIVEDILSCVRVGRCKPSIALLGTSSSDTAVAAVYNEIARAGAISDTILWLDPDRAGKSASYDLARSLRLRGCNVRVRSTKLDPKLYSNREIKEILSVA